ncbi:MAG: LacI family DNA-binding transcriptional regulator [Anaerostipes sp.]
MEKKTRKRKKATMADVAAAVGVSKTTISRYLHGDYEFMSEETRKRYKMLWKS